MKKHNILHKKNILLLCTSSILIATSCARFKVDKLKPEVLYTASINQGELSVKIPQNKSIYYGLPSRVAFSEERLVVPETENQSIKIFGPNGLETIIASPKNAKKLIKKKRALPKGVLAKVKIVSSNLLQFPGMTIAGNDEDFFVLNKVIVKSDEKKVNIFNDSFTSKTKIPMKGYFKILHFSLKGKLLNEIGRQGQVQLPFENIIWLDVDKENRLWVLFRNLGQIYLESFAKHSLHFSMNQTECVNTLFSKVNKEKDIAYNCEYMYPFYDEDKILIIGKVEKTSNNNKTGGYTFKHRVFLSYDTITKKTKEIFSQLTDPDDYPYLPYDNNHFILWQTKDDYTFKFALYNLNGDLSNNLQIKLTGKRTAWRTPYLNLNGKIDSIRVRNSKFELIRWN